MCELASKLDLKEKAPQRAQVVVSATVDENAKQMQSQGAFIRSRST
jgi:hypothetical protein